MNGDLLFYVESDPYHLVLTIVEVGCDLCVAQESGNLGIFLMTQLRTWKVNVCGSPSLMKLKNHLWHITVAGKIYLQDAHDTMNAAL